MARETLKLCMKFEFEEVQFSRMLEMTKWDIEDTQARIPGAEKEFQRFKTRLDAVILSGVAVTAAVDNSGPDELLGHLLELSRHIGQTDALLPLYKETKAALNHLEEFLRRTEIHFSEIQKELADVKTALAAAIHLLRQYPAINVKNFPELEFVKKNTTSQPIYQFPFTPTGFIA